MSPDEVNRVLNAFHASVGQMKEHVRAEIGAVKNELLGEMSKVTGEVIKLGGKAELHEKLCEKTHKSVDEQLGSHRGKITALETENQQETRAKLQSVTNEIATRDAEKRKWVFWGIAGTLSFLLGGGGLAGLIWKILLHH